MIAWDWVRVRAIGLGHQLGYFGVRVRVLHGLAVIWLLPSHLELMLTPLEKVIAGVKDAVTREKSSLKVLIREDNQRGVYTTRPFRKGQFVAEYAGEFVTMEESLRLEEEYRSNGEGCYLKHWQGSSCGCKQVLWPDGKVNQPCKQQPKLEATPATDNRRAEASTLCCTERY